MQCVFFFCLYDTKKAVNNIVCAIQYSLVFLYYESNVLYIVCRISIVC